MDSIILFSNIILFSVGCIGTASMIFLHTCLKMKLTRYFTVLFSVLLFSLGRILLSLYLAGRAAAFNLPPAFNVSIGIILSLSVYILIYFILSELENVSKFSAALSTVLIISIQAARTLLYYTGTLELSAFSYITFICIISAYLFFAGRAFHKGVKRFWNPAVKKMVRRMGSITLVFAPASALIYTSLYLMNFRNRISLDFIFMGIWSVVSAVVLFGYLSRIGTVPVSDAVDDDFIARYGISRREKEVLALILQGYTNKEIGEKLYISLTTARTHVSHIFEKAGVSSRIQLVSKVLAEKIS